MATEEPRRRPNGGRVRRVPLSVEETWKQIDYEGERRDRAHGRWVVGLAVGNGGGLLALAGLVFGLFQADDITAANGTIALVYPSAWLFVLGLIAAGLNPYLDRIRARRWRSAWIDQCTAYANSETIPLVDPAWEATNKKLSFAQSFSEVIAALSFIAATAWPLVVLAMRYHSTGWFLTQP